MLLENVGTSRTQHAGDPGTRLGARQIRNTNHQDRRETTNKQDTKTIKQRRYAKGPKPSQKLLLTANRHLPSPPAISLSPSASPPYLMRGADDELLADEQEEQAQSPGSPASEHNSWASSAETAQPGNSPMGADDQGSQRRPKRCKISREQLNILIKSFDDEPLPNFDQRQALAKVLGMTPRSVQIWFQNRRQRLKPANPKSGSCDMSSAPLSQRQRSPQAQATQQFGIPGLAAVAGLCNSYAAGPESLLMSKAMAQLPLNQASGGGLGSLVNGLPYDVMEPFAATKALLGAGYQPPASLSLATRLQPSQGGQSCGCGPAGLSSASRGGATTSVGGSASANASGTPGASGGSSGTGVAQADGLLLLLACASGAASSVQAPSVDAVLEPSAIAA